jgi:short-subunit dehydrogenase
VSCANSSSLRGCSPTPWGGPYAASKAALVALTDTLDMELQPFNVNVMLLVTGLVRTRMHENAALQQTILPDRSPYAPYAETIAVRTKVNPDICMDPNAFAREGETGAEGEPAASPSLGQLCDGGGCHEVPAARDAAEHVCSYSS